MPQVRYSSIMRMVYSMPASLKEAFLAAMDSSDSFGAKGFGKIQFLEMISQSLRSITQPLRDRAMLMVAAASSTGMMPTSTGIQMPAPRILSIQRRKASMSQHSWVMM